MIYLSTGQPSVLGVWRDYAAVYWGPDSASVKFLDDKITTAEHGVAEEVYVDETQMILMLHTIHYKDVPSGVKEETTELDYKVYPVLDSGGLVSAGDIDDGE